MISAQVPRFWDLQSSQIHEINRKPPASKVIAELVLILFIHVAYVSWQCIWTFACSWTVDGVEVCGFQAAKTPKVTPRLTNDGVRLSGCSYSRRLRWGVISTATFNIPVGSTLSAG